MSSTSTKPRRSKKVEHNPVVARRLALVPDAQRKAAAKRFLEGESMATLSKELGVSVTHAAYALRQEAVESGKVSHIDPSDKAGIKAALGGEYGDFAWLACRAGVSNIKALVK